MLTFIYGLINILTYSVRNYLSKHVLSSIDSITYFSVNNILYTIVSLFIAMVMKIDIKALRNMDTKTTIYLLIGPVIGTISVLVYYELIKMYEISTLNPIISVAANICIMIMGICMFGETLTLNKIIGTLLATAGIYFMIKK
jgi:uncharacterized membrane protein